MRQKSFREKMIKKNQMFPGPTAADVLATLVQRCAPDVEAYLTNGGAIADDVMEVFSPPRILEHTVALGLRGDLSADLATGWDLSLEHHRANLLTEIVRRRPKIVILEPPCTWFSQLLSLNWKHMPRHLREQRLAAAVVLFEFCLLIMRIRLHAGRAFILEHPLGATSWKHPQINDVMFSFANIFWADFDFCMFGTRVKKATRLMTNIPHVYKRFMKVRCD